MRPDRRPGRQRAIGELFSSWHALAGWVLSVVLVLLAASCMGPGDDAAPPPPSNTSVPAPAASSAPTTAAPVTTAARPPSPSSTTAPPTSTTVPEITEFHVSPDGSDDADGSREDPWGTLSHAFRQLEAGDTLLVHGGTYPEQVQVDVEPGTAEEPITVRAVEGEEPVIRGLLWVRYLDHWVIDGINVTWDEEENEDDDHMVKLTDGDHWELRNSELWGAQSFAALLVAGTTDGHPEGWRVANNCIHDTLPSNGTNEDHLIYVNSGPANTDGLIENNLLFGADNGSGVKLGGSSQNAGAAHGVTVRNNTILDAAQPILVSWQSSNNTITGNFFAGTDEGYGHIRGFELEGEGNVASDNGGDDHPLFILNDEGYTGVEDGGNNVDGLELEVSGEPSCDLQGQVAGYGLETALGSMPSP